MLLIQDSVREFLMDSLEKHGLPTTNGPAPANAQLDDLGDLHEAIAVVGMSCRFPGANNVDEFWDLLISSRDPIRKFPLDRPKPASFDADEKKWFQAGFLSCPVDEFDAKFFGISPREAPFVDPQQRLLLEVIWESLENANINPHSLRESNTGVFVGIWQQEYDKLMPNSGLTANDFHHRYLGNAFSATASRISHFLGLYGPNYSIE
jgi:acyl transferase domain-containing protein